MAMLCARLHLSSVLKSNQLLLNSSKVTISGAKSKSSDIVHGIPNTKISRVGLSKEAGQGADGAAFLTNNRDDFARAFPKLKSKQDYHIAQLKKHIPVHRSYKYSEVTLPLMYGGCVLLLLISFYQSWQLI